MMKIIILLMFCCLGQTYAQQKLSIKLLDVPEKKSFKLYLLAFHNNGFQKLDSIVIDSNGLYTFKIPSNTANGLMQLTMPDAVNQSEFIYNAKEALALEASYWALKNGDVITENSLDNAAYLQLSELQGQYQKYMSEFEEQKKLLTPFQPDYRKAWGNLETRVELLQQELNRNLTIIEERYPQTFTAEVLVQLAKIPIRTAEQTKEFDGYLAFLNQHFFDHVDFDNSQLLQHYAFVDKIFYYLTTYTQKTEDGTKRGLDYLLSLMKTNDAINSVVFNNLLQTFIKLDNEIFTLYLVKNSKQGCALDLDYTDLKKLQTIQALSIGGLAPDLLLYDEKKEVQSLHAYCKKNSLTIVYVWISWCAHCKKTTPQLQALFEQYKKKGLGVFAVSLDEDEQKWKAALNESKTTWVNTAELVAIKQSKVAPSYHVSNTPALFILDKEGKVVAKNLFGKDLEDFLKKQF